MWNLDVKIFVDFYLSTLNVDVESRFLYFSPLNLITPLKLTFHDMGEQKGFTNLRRMDRDKGIFFRPYYLKLIRNFFVSCKSSLNSSKV